jgi:PAS domain S-box-containing protein
MFSPATILAVCCLYMAALFAIAMWVERRAAAGKDIGNNPIIYTLSLTVYLTAWTFYGSVGKAASAGMLFVTFYLGPTLGMFLWWIIVRKMVRVKNNFRVTSIADFISLRYNKSMSIAALVTLISIVGIVPYLALQLKAVISTFTIISQQPNRVDTSWLNRDIGLIVVVAIILFTIILGVRRVVPTERHQGIVAVLAAEGVVKLVALLAAGLFVLYSMFNGLGDIFKQFSEHPQYAAIREVQASPSFYVTWFSYLLLSMSAFLFLPRQFHVAVVENFDEKHIRTAMWLCPLYMFLVTFCVLPIAMGGLVRGNAASAADAFVLLLPFASGHASLSLLVFLGGFTAAIGIIMICSMTIATMATNHLMLPCIEHLPALRPLKRYVLQCRWLTVAILILASYWFEQHVAAFFSLVDIGLIAFVAVLQFAPATLGGLFWKRANKAGALAAMTAGSLVWAYTLILPAFIRGGMISESVLLEGPFGIASLRPEQLLGASGLDPISHAVLWTMFVNIGLYVAASLCVKQSPDEEANSETFVASTENSVLFERTPGESTIDLRGKCEKVESLFRQYFPAEKAAELTRFCLESLRIGPRKMISLVELAELQNEAERQLAGSIGAATAHQAISRAAIITSVEEDAMQRMLSDVVAELKLTPADLTRKVAFLRDQEKFRAVQAKQLQEKIDERDREIAVRRRVEESLRNSERRMADILDLLPDTTFAIDLEGRVILWNRAAEEYTGFKAEDMLGKGNYEYGIPFHGERRPLLIDYVLAPPDEVANTYVKMTRRGHVLTGEAYARCVRGAEAYALIVASPLYDSDGKAVGAIESIRDITERKRAEEELARHRDKLEELVKERTIELDRAKEAAVAANRAKSDFLANMSHEIRTPMTAILGYADVLRADVETPEDIDAIETIKRNGDHLLTLINDILDLSRIEAGEDKIERVPCSPISVVAETESLMRVRAATKGLPLEIAYDGPIPATICSEPVRLRQILINLVGNAIKFTDAGNVTITLRMTPANEGSRPFLRFDVSDTGIGISDKQFGKLFRPFTQADESITRTFGGTGLGLAISKRLANGLGGDLTVNSIEGEGSTFTLTIDPGPLDGVAFIENPGQTVQADAARDHRPIAVHFLPDTRILLAEDGIDNQRLLSYFLTKAGAEVTIADNGEIAVNKVVTSMAGLMRRQGDPTGPFDLILMDMQMPVMDGYEATRRLREAGYTNPILALTAHAMKEDRQKCLDAGCTDHISKPVKREAFLATVASYVVKDQPSQTPREKVAGPV